MELEKNDINYKIIATEFITTFENSIKNGISFVESYFDKDSLCTMHIYKGNDCDVTECYNYNTLKSKMYSLNINTFNYNKYVYTSQPLTDYNILLTVNGTVNINNNIYTFSPIFIVIKNFNNCFIIKNYILSIFM